jgi:hypothetical protein
MVRLLLFRCADVTRNCLPDHRIPPSPRPLAAALKCFARSFSSLDGRPDRTPRAKPAIPIGTGRDLPSIISSRVRRKSVRRKGKESGVASKLNGIGSDRPELEHARDFCWRKQGAIMAASERRREVQAYAGKNAPCPIHCASFEKWVGNLSPQPAFRRFSLQIRNYGRGAK